MQPQLTTTLLSVDEYLAGELESQVRHEYVDGEVYAMVGASDRHGLVTLNLAGLLSQRLPERCQVFSSDMKVRIQTVERDIFYYPDVLVSCDPRDREPYFRQYPCLVAEVLSPHTARLDRFEKFLFYRQLDTLEEYLLVSQDYRQIEVFRRAEQWQATPTRRARSRFVQSTSLSASTSSIGVPIANPTRFGEQRRVRDQRFPLPPLRSHRSRHLTLARSRQILRQAR